MIAASLRLLCRTLFIALPLAGCLAQPLAVEAQWHQLLTELSRDNTHRVISAQEWQRYEPELLSPLSQYPLLAHYNWDTLRRLRVLHDSCRPELDYPADLQRPVAFELALCHRTELTPDWFENGSRLHPAGGGYLDRYLEARESWGDSADVLLDGKLSTVRHLLTLTHPLHPLAARLNDLGERGLSRIQTSDHPYITAEAADIWLRNEAGVFRFPGDIWQPLARQLNIDITPYHSDSACTLVQGNVCVGPKNRLIDPLVAALVALSVFATAAIIRLSWQRYQAMRERRFILQLLTHELRTPIASLALTVEQLRSQFDRLDGTGQNALGRLLQDQQRLQQVAYSSQGYLSQNASLFAAARPLRLSDWLDHATANYPALYCLEEDAELSLPYYWLGLCLDNLLRNALEHGGKPIRVWVRLGRRLEIEVMDHGHYPRRWHQHQSPGRGFGLGLVRRLLKRLGGRLRRQRHPTRFTLELPLP